MPRDSKLVLRLAPETLIDYDGGARMRCLTRVYRTSYREVDCELTPRGTVQGEPTYVDQITVSGLERVTGFWSTEETGAIKIVDVRNVEFQRERSVDLNHEFMVVSQNGFVLSQGAFADVLLPDFEANAIEAASAERMSENIGEKGVRYVLTFTTPNLIRGGSYALIYVPNEQATVEEERLTCEDVVARHRKDCELYEEQDGFTVVKMEDLCKRGAQVRCEGGDRMELLLRLSNSNSLSSNFLASSFKVEVYTSNDELIEHIDEGVLVTPELSGVDLADIEMERKDNLVGGLDFLKFYLPSLDGTFTVDTDMVVALPEGLAFFKRGEVPLCQRTFIVQGASTLVNVECEIETYEEYYAELWAANGSEEDGDDDEEEDEPSELIKVRSIRLKALCDQYHVCVSRRDLEFQVQVVNPPTNRRPAGENTVQLMLQQEESDGVRYDVGMGQASANGLEDMLPNHLAATIGPFPGDSCH